MTRGISVLAKAAILSLCAMSAWADGPDARGFDLSRYEGAYLEAERSRGGAEAWLGEAKDGVALFAARWERDAAALYSDPEAFAVAKAGLIEWTEGDLARRFGDWLRDRFFGRAASRLRASVAAGVGAANAEYLYVTDGDGRVVYDDAGDPEYSRSMESLADDGAGWREDAESAASSSLGEFSGWIERMRPELLAYAPEGERARYEAAIREAGDAARYRVGAELDMLIAREERLFVARRTTDVWSLRKRSDGEAAQAVAANIARETAEACDDDIAALSERIEAAEAMAVDADLRLMGEEWLAAFEEQFRRGLETWRRAEERFMVRRLEWEREAGMAYLDGTEAWAEAYERLEAEERAWEAKAGALLRSGEAAFERASEALESSIASAKAEFEAGAAVRSQASAERAEAWVGVYLEAGGAAASVKDGVSYWLGLLGPDAPEVGSAELEAWLEAAAVGAGAGRLDTIAQARSALRLYGEYAEKAQEARARLTELCALELGGEDRSLLAVLAPGASSEDFHLDEYQVALLRARAVEGYWRKRAGIAQAVLDYAVDLSSGRATEGEQIARLASTRAAYDSALAEYGVAADALSAAGSVQGDARSAMDEARMALSAASSALSALQNEYALLMGELAADDDGEFVGEELYDRYRSLVEASGFSSLPGAPSEAALVAGFIEAAGRLGYASDLERSGEALRLAVQGGGGEPSLSALSGIALAIAAPASFESGVLADDRYRIPDGDLGRSIMASLRAGMEAELSEAGGAEEAEAIKVRYGRLAAAVAEGAKARAEAVLASRSAGIALLGATDAASWYSDRTGNCLDPDADLEETLAADARAANLALLMARVALELEAVSIVRGDLDSGEAGEAAASLAALGVLDPARADGADATLSALLATLGSLAADGEQRSADAIAAACAEDPDAAAFLRGRGYFALSGQDAGSLWLAREYRESELARAMSEAYARFGAYSPAVEDSRLAKARSILSERFASLGLGFDGALPKAKALGAALIGSDDPASAVAGLIQAIDEAASLSPDWVDTELEWWKASVVEYAAAKAIADAMPAPEASSSLSARVAAERRRATALGSMLDKLTSTGDAYARALVEAADALEWSPSESANLFYETAAYLAEALSDGFGALPDEPDWEAAEASLADSASERFGYASGELRGRSVRLALDGLKAADASARSRDPGSLDGAARASRLAEIWSGFDASAVADAAMSGVNLTARAAYAMRIQVLKVLEAVPDAARDDLLSYAERTGDEPSWLESYTQAEGEDAGAAMAILLSLALGDEAEPWTLAEAMAKVEAAAADSLDEAKSLRDTLRSEMGSASMVAERMLGVSLAELSPDVGYLSWALGILGLSACEDAAAFVGSGADSEAEAYLGLAREYSSDAAEFYLARLGLSGDAESFGKTLERVDVADAERGSRLLAIVAAAKRYAGQYSGAAILWADGALAGTAYENDAAAALALARLVETGSLDDALATRIGRAVDRSSESDAFRRLVIEAASTASEESLATARELSGRREYAAAFEAAERIANAAAENGERHWRQALGSEGLSRAAAARVGGAIAMPGAAGDSEAELVDIPTLARSWAEGSLADAYEEAARSASRLDAALGAWGGAIVDLSRAGSESYESRAAFRAKATAYIDDPSKVFDPDDVTYAAVASADAYRSKRSEYALLEARRIEARTAIARLAKAYEIASDEAAIKARLVELEIELGDARADQGLALNRYSDAAIFFESSGRAYDAAYGIAKVKYDEAEAARTAYETEDAIRRWASTAYLASDGDELPGAIGTRASYRSPDVELEYARSSLERAEAALEALAGLYDDGQAERPYADAAYAAAVKAYRDQYLRMTLAAKARDAVAGALAEECRANDEAHATYMAALYGGGERTAVASSLSYADFSPATEPEDAGWMDVLCIRGGALALSYDSSFRIDPVDVADAAALEAYFGDYSKETGTEHGSTEYERDARAWGDRVSSYLGSSEQSFEEWAKARDYLLVELAKANPRYRALDGAVRHADDLRHGVGGMRIGGITLAERLGEHEASTLAGERRSAWEGLGSQERADLEFYIVMTMTGGAVVSSDAFQAASQAADYAFIEGEMSRHIDAKSAEAKGYAVAGSIYFGIGLALSWIPPASLMYAGMAAGMFLLSDLATGEAEEWSSVKAEFVDAGLRDAKALVALGAPSLQAELGGVRMAYQAYIESCGRLACLKGEATPDVAPEEALRESLGNAGLTGDEVGDLVEWYAEFRAAEPGEEYAGAEVAMCALARRSRNGRDDAIAALERVYEEDAARREVAEAAYRAAYDRYIDGEASAAELAAAARMAFGPDAASRKTHLARLGDAIADAALDSPTEGLSSESADGAARYAALVARAAEARLASELAARDAEWDSLRRELADKRSAWSDAGGLILSRGHADFDRGFAMMRERGAAWLARFKSEYGSKSAAWDLAYADMMSEKLSWAARATDAADEAGSDAMLAMVGADAAAGARLMETASVSSVEFEDGASAAFAEALDRSGIGGMLASLRGQIAGAGTAAKFVWAGAGGTAAWDSGRILVAAAEFAQTTECGLAGIQARVLASRAREAAEAAVSGLYDSVRDANEGFGRSMDDLYVSSGTWRREGDAYVKNVVVHSTVAHPLITESASVGTYDYFETAPLKLSIDLSDGALEGLSAVAIRALIAKVQGEVRKKGEEVFGEEGESGPSHVIEYYKDAKVEEKKTVTRRGPEGVEYEVEEIWFKSISVLDEARTVTETEGAGSFGEYLGYAAHLSDDLDPGNSESMFQGDSGKGSGELGRLMREYLYWAVREGAGWAEANKPKYEKDLWDDRGSWFQAPTIRGMAEMGVGAAAIALSGGTALPALLGAAGINLVDDAVFGALDVAGGYKSWEEAGLEFGKKALSSAASVASTGVFGGYDGALGFFERGLSSGLSGADGLGGAIGRSMLSGTRALATGVAVGAIDSVYWDADTGWGLSGDAFAERMRGGFASSAAAMASGLTSGALELGLEGFTGKAYADGLALSSFVGGLAGQAATYGLTGDATFNLANFDMFGLMGSNGDAISMGLLELRLGKDGASMNLGAGGMDASLGRVASAAAGLESWAANARMLFSGQAEAKAYASAMRTLYSAGSSASDERNLFERILSGQANIVGADFGEYKARTAYDSTSGTHTISLGSDALGDGTRFGLNILLAHEAYRNGVDDGEVGQGEETYRAALGHIGVAGALAATYGEAVLSQDQRAELGALRAAYAGDASSIALALGRYDSGGDFWKLTKDGSLLNDGEARLLVEIANDDGTRGWRLVEGSEGERSVSAALTKYLGEPRAKELLGASLTDVSQYDDQTLHDILNLDHVDIKAMRRNPAEAQRAIMAASDEQKTKLMGEALMKRAGIEWDGSSWKGEGGGIALSDQAIQGSAAIRSIGDGLYERFSITSEIERYEGAYDAWKDGIKGDLGAGNTRIAFTKWDVDSGEQLATLVAGGAWNSVDNSYGQLDRDKNPIGTDKQYQILGGPTLQGNTIAAGALDMRWAKDGSKPEWGDVFILSDTRTIAGETIGVDGRRPGHVGEDRWLMHWTNFGSSDGCVVSKSEAVFKQFLDTVKTWGLYQGYSITGSLFDENPYPDRLGYKKGIW